MADSVPGSAGGLFPSMVDVVGGTVDVVGGMVDVVGGMVGVMGVMVGVMDKDMRFNSL